MALDAMESMFDLDEETTMDAGTRAPDRQNDNGAMYGMMKNMMQTENGQYKLPFCVQMCGVHELMENFGNLTETIVRLHRSMSTLEICIVVMTCVITIFTITTITLMVYYIRNKKGGDDDNINKSIRPCPSSNSSMGLTVPSSANGSETRTTMASASASASNTIYISPPPSRQGEEYRVNTPTPSAWLNMTKDGPIDKTGTPAASPDPCVPTPVPIEFDQDDAYPISVPAQVADVGYLAVKHVRMRKPSWPNMGNLQVKPLEDDLKEANVNTGCS